MSDIDIVARLKLAGEDFSAKFKGQMDAVEAQAKSASSRISTALTSLRGLAGGFISAATVTTIAVAAQRGLEYASSLGEVSQQLGVTTKDLQTYRYVATQTGLDQDTMDASLAKLTQTIGKAAVGAKAPAAAFKALGIDIRDANGQVKAAGQVIPEIADALSKVASPAQRAAAEIALFGRAGQQLDTVLAGGSKAISELAAEAERLGLVLDQRLIDQADAAADKVSTLKQVLEVKIAGAVAENANAIVALADAMIRVASAAGGAIIAVKQFNNLQVAGSAVAGADAKKAARDELLSSPSGRRALFEDLKARRKSSQAAYEGDLVKSNADITARAAREQRFVAEYAEIVARSKVVPKASPRPAAGNDNDLPTFLAAAPRAARDTAKAAKEAELALTPIGKQFGDIKVTADAARDSAQEFYQQLNVGSDGGLDAVRDQIEKNREIRSDEIEREYEARVEADQRLNQQREDAVRDVAGLYEDLFEGGTSGLWKSFKRQGQQVIAELAARYTLALLTGQNTSFGSILSSASGTGSPLDRLAGLTNVLGTGGKTSTSGPYNEEGFGLSTVGAAAKGGGLLGKLGIGGGAGGASGALSGIGQAAGAFGLAVAANQVIGDIFGFKGGPLGIFTGLLSGSKSGVASISSIDGTAALAGTSGKSKEAASGLAGSIQSTLKQVADALDAKLGSFAVSIGLRNGDYRVDPTGRGNLKVKKGVLDFGDDQEAAIRYAIGDALKDGVVQGISDAEQRILQSGQDLDAALEKVLSLRSITTDLQQRLDPVGYAVDQINKKFTDLVAILDESGASAEKRAEAEQLYKLELADAQKVSGGAKQALQDFLDSFKVGSSSPLSLRDQEAAAQAALQPFLDKISASTTVDQDAYLKAAQSFLDVERQLYGSTDAYFQALDKVQAATNAAIATIDKTSPIRGTTVDPFAEKTASNTLATAEIGAQTRDLLLEQNGLLRQALAAAGGTGSIWAASERGFVA